MYSLLRLVAMTAAAALIHTSSAQAQFRPGSSPDGGRIRALCNSERLPVAERKECERMMRNAKTSEERAAAKAMVQERIAARQKDYDEQMRKDATINALGNTINPGGN